MIEIVKTGNVSSSPKHAFKFSKRCSQQFDELPQIFEGKMISAGESALTNLDSDERLTNQEIFFRPRAKTNQELAAIVVGEQQQSLLLFLM